MALGQGRPEGEVAAGTEAAGIAEVLKSERAGRLLPFKEEQIIASSESVAGEGMTADDVWSHLGDSELFEAYGSLYSHSLVIDKKIRPMALCAGSHRGLNG